MDPHAPYYTTRPTSTHLQAIVFQAEGARDASCKAKQYLGARYDELTQIARPFLTPQQMRDMDDQGWCDAWDGIDLEPKHWR